jgi:hypothetical protein
MKRLALSALVLLIPALVWADEKETMLHALGQFQQATKKPCTVGNNPCQTREIWLAQQAAQAADQYLDTREAKERHERNWRLVALSVIRYSKLRTEAYAEYVRHGNPHAYNSIVNPLEQEFLAQLRATLRSDVNSREIARRFGLVDF